jgi:hypothetical protein
MANISQDTIRKKFEKLPDAIREWLTSEKVTYMIVDINRRLDLVGYLSAIIPGLITRLVVGDLSPEYFTQELSDNLFIELGDAKNISNEIEDKILKPIASQLRNIDIDIVKIKDAKKIPYMPPSQNKAEPQIITQGQPERATTQSQSNINNEVSALGDSKQPVNGTEPFVIHEEIPTFKVPIRIEPRREVVTQQPPKETEIPKPHISKDIVPPPSSQSRLNRTGVIPIKISTQVKMLPKTQHAKVHRVVHYSNFRTPIK